MVLRYARTAWGRARGRLRLSEPSPNSQLLVDYSSHGSGNGKRNQKSLKLLLEVSSLRSVILTHEVIRGHHDNRNRT